jgi:hypothetical protein
VEEPPAPVAAETLASETTSEGSVAAPKGGALPEPAPEEEGQDTPSARADDDTTRDETTDAGAEGSSVPADVEVPASEPVAEVHTPATEGDAPTEPAAETAAAAPDLELEEAKEDDSVAALPNSVDGEETSELSRTLKRASSVVLATVPKPSTPPVTHYSELPLDYTPSKLLGLDETQVLEQVKTVAAVSPVKRMERKKVGNILHAPSATSRRVREPRGRRGERRRSCRPLSMVTLSSTMVCAVASLGVVLDQTIEQHACICCPRARTVGSKARPGLCAQVYCFRR